MTVLVYVEHQSGAPTPGSLGVLAKGKELAAELGGELVAMVVGSGIRDLAAGLGAYGAGRVLVADDARFASPVPTPLVDALAAAVAKTGATAVLASASVLAADVMGGLAARLGAGLNVDGVDIRVQDGQLVHRRPALDDSVQVDSTWDSDVAIALFRAGSFQAATANGGQASVEELDVPDTGRRAQEHLGVEEQQGGGVDITQADVLVGGGRGLGGPENFHLVESLAQTLGGEVATTRAVVDAGWYDYATQVGQTGKTVQPKLYFAVGISGAIQHKIGMQNAGTIIAINKDPNAPIFEFADFGVVGDLFQVVPQLEEKLKARKG